MSVDITGLVVVIGISISVGFVLGVRFFAKELLKWLWGKHD